MTPHFDMKKVTTPLLLHMLGKEVRFPELFLLRCKFTLGRFKKTIDKRFPGELIDLAALPAWVYLNLKRKIGQHRAFEILRVALLTGGTAMQNLQFDTIHKEKNFQNFSELEIENNRTGLVRWNTAGTRWKSSNARRGASKSRSRAACSMSLQSLWASRR